jgi:hypothetical protein
MIAALRRWRDRRDDRGMITTYVAIVATSLILMTGLVVDGGAKIRTYVEASHLADGAARAGAQAVDENTLYASGRVRIDAAEATQRAREYVADSGPDSAEVVHVAVNGNTVTVTVQIWQRSKMLQNTSQWIAATESATALRGVETGG